MNPLQGIDFGALVILKYNHDQLSKQQIQHLEKRVFARASKNEIRKLGELLIKVENIEKFNNLEEINYGMDF